MQQSNNLAAHHEQLFEAVGKKVEGMSLNESGDKGSCENEDDGPKLVEEIESYCMNCGENVYIATGPSSLLSLLIYTGSRVQRVYS